MSREPSVVIGAVFTLVLLAYSFFFEGSAESQLKLTEFLEGLVPLIAALFIRSQVVPAKAPRA